MTSIDIYSILSTKSHNPHYLKRYYKFILWCNQVNVTKTKEFLVNIEQHHICPKAKDLFPEYDCFKKNPWNKIVLTTRQHFIAHWMLSKTYGRSQAYGFYAFINQKSPRHVKSKRVISISSRTYELSKINAGKYISENRKGKVSCINTKTNTRLSVSSQEFYSNDDLVGSNTGIDRSYMHSENWKSSMREAGKDRVKITHSTLPNRYVKSYDVQQFLDIGYIVNNNCSWYDRKDHMKICQYCHRSIDPANYAKWHGDKCKLKN